MEGWPHIAVGNPHLSSERKCSLLILVPQFHGGLSIKRRAMAIEAFTKRSNIHILLSTLKTGSVGLNLTAASRVILVDPWW